MAEVKLGHKYSDSVLGSKCFFFIVLQIFLPVDRSPSEVNGRRSVALGDEPAPTSRCVGDDCFLEPRGLRHPETGQQAGLFTEVAV